MGLRLIYGRAGSGKSKYCFDKIIEGLEIAPEKRQILIVPEQYSFVAEKQLVNMVKQNTGLNAEVLSFNRLAYRIFNEVGGITQEFINAAGKSILVYKVMDQIKGELEVFSKAIHQKGFVNSISETITEFKRYHWNEEVFDRIQSQADSEFLKKKISEIRLIITRYEELLSLNYRDMDDALNILAESISESESLYNAEIWIDQFTDFSPQQRRIIEKMLYKCYRVNIALCTDCIQDDYMLETDIFSSVKKEASLLLKLAGGCNIKVELPICVSKNDYNRSIIHNGLNSKISLENGKIELQHLEQQFFSYPYKKYEKETEAIQLFCATNVFSEIDYVARQIITLCRDKGYRYSEIAIAIQNLEDYEKLLTAVFEQYKIPYFIDSKKDVLGNPVALLVLSMLEIFNSNWSYEAVFKYLKTGLVNIDIDQIDRLENYILATGIKGRDKWTGNQKWSYIHGNWNGTSITEEQEKQLEEMNAIRYTIIEPIMRFRERVLGGCLGKEMCTALFDFLCDIAVPDKIEEITEQYKASGEFEAASQYGQVWNILIQLMDQIVQVMGEEKIGVRKFAEILAIGLSEFKIGIIPSTVEQIMIGNVQRSKAGHIKVLFVLGANDGILPSTGMQEGILSDTERQKLEELGASLAKTTRQQTFEQQFLIYKLLSLPSEYLHISWPIADHEGRTMRPSYIVSRIKKVFPKVSSKNDLMESEDDVAQLEYIAAPLPAFNKMILKIREEADGKKNSELWKEVFSWFCNSEEWSPQVKKALNGLVFGAKRETLSKENIQGLYPGNIYTSVTRFEKYQSCPFAYFLKYGLSIKERRTHKITSLDTGSFMHSIIEKVSKRIEKDERTWEDIDEAWITDAVADAVRLQLKAMGNAGFNSSARYQYMAKRLTNQIIRAIKLIAEQVRRGKFRPIRYEVAFGKGSKADFDSVRIELGDDTNIELSGIIDRLDIYENEEGTFVRIVDYKTGNRSLKLQDVYYGLQLQLLTYMSAVCPMQKEGEWIPGGIFYLKLDSPIIRAARTISKEQAEKEIMKQLRLKGLILAKPEIVDAMDTGIIGASDVIPVYIRKDGSLGRASAATMEQFRALQEHIKTTIKQIGREIINGNISVSPYKSKKQKACDFCEYSSVCLFDPVSGNDSYRLLPEKEESEIWGLIQK